MFRRSTDNTTQQVRAFLQHKHPWLAFGVLALHHGRWLILSIISLFAGVPAVVHWLG